MTIAEFPQDQIFRLKPEDQWSKEEKSQFNALDFWGKLAELPTAKAEETTAEVDDSIFTEKETLSSEDEVIELRIFAIFALFSQGEEHAKTILMPYGKNTYETLQQMYEAFKSQSMEVEIDEDSYKAILPLIQSNII